MSSDCSTPWRDFLPPDLPPLPLISAPTQARILLDLPATPSAALGPNSHIKKRASWAAATQLRNAALIATREQDELVFDPETFVVAYTLIHWEKGRQIRDPDNANAAMKVAYDVLQRRGYLDNDRKLHSYTQQHASKDGYGTTQMLVVGELNPELPADHVCIRWPIGSPVWFQPNPSGPPFLAAGTIVAHNPGAVEDLWIWHPALMTAPVAIASSLAQ